MLKIQGMIIYFVLFSSCASSAQSLKNMEHKNEEHEKMVTYGENDVILFMGKAQYNIANKQYNYEITILGNGDVERKGGVYEKEYPNKVDSAVLDTIIRLGRQISSLEVPSKLSKPFLHDGPSCHLKVYGDPASYDFCGGEYESLKSLIEYVDSKIILPVQ